MYEAGLFEKTREAGLNLAYTERDLKESLRYFRAGENSKEEVAYCATRYGIALAEYAELRDEMEDLVYGV